MIPGFASAHQPTGTRVRCLDADETRLLDGLMLGCGRAAPMAAASGIRRARTRGAGAEFHEYRHYQPGDDPRSIDWTVEARLQQLVVRVARAQGHLALHALVDVSASMGIGEPTKLACAVRTAAALSYLAVEGRDAAGVATFTDQIHAYVRPGGGRVQLARIFDTLEGAAPGGASQVSTALERYAAVARGPGLVAVLSDWFDEDLGARGLQALLHRGLVPVIVQIVAPEETNPDVADDVELRDIEQAGGSPLVVGTGAVAAYRERLNRHWTALREMCLARGLICIRLESTATLTDMLVGFESAGLIGV